MDLYLSLLPGVYVVMVLVLYTLSLRVHYTARWRLIACFGACLNAYLREPRLRAMLGSHSLGGVEFSTGRIWPMENSECVRDLMLTLT